MNSSSKIQDEGFEYGLLVTGEDKKNPFPYNLMKIRNYLKKTGKTLDEVSYKELLPFAIKDRISVKH